MHQSRNFCVLHGVYVRIRNCTEAVPTCTCKNKTKTKLKLACHLLSSSFDGTSHIWPVLKLTCQLLATQSACKDSSAAIGNKTRLQADMRPRHLPGTTLHPATRCPAVVHVLHAGGPGHDKVAESCLTPGGLVPFPVCGVGDVIVGSWS